MVEARALDAGAVQVSSAVDRTTLAMNLQGGAFRVELDGDRRPQRLHWTRAGREIEVQYSGYRGLGAARRVLPGADRAAGRRPRGRGPHRHRFPFQPVATVENDMLQEPWTMDPVLRRKNPDPQAWFWGVIPCKERDAEHIIDRNVRG
jgi:hypothetical protein